MATKLKLRPKRYVVTGGACGVMGDKGFSSLTEAKKYFKDRVVASVNKKCDWYYRIDEQGTGNKNTLINEAGKGVKLPRMKR